MLKIKRLESQISNKTKTSKQDRQNQLRLPMPEGGEQVNQNV